MAGKEIVAFGVFEVDLLVEQVRKSGVPVRLQEQPFRILKALLERPGEIVTREELRGQIWGEDIYVDFDRSLNTGIARLREALGDSPTRPIYIETVPRKGYRFIATVGPDSQAADASAAAHSDPAGAPRRRYWLIGLLPTGVLLALAAAGTDWSAPVRHEPLAPLEPQRLTYYEGSESEASFSPDGSQVAFTWNGPSQDNLDIYIKTVGADGRIRLTDHPNRDFSPMWSPNGKWVAFLREDGDGRAGVYRMPPLGGREARLGDVAFPPFRYEGGTSIPDRHLGWSTNSELLAVTDRDSAASPLSIFSVSTATGVKRRLTDPPAGSIGDRNPVFSPDGKNLAFTGFRADGLGVYLVPLTRDLSPAAEPRLVVRQFGMPRGLAWGRDDRELLVIIENELWAVDIESSQTKRRLPFAGAMADLPALSSSAARVAYTQKVGVANIWEIGLVQGVAQGQPSKVVSSSGSNVNFQISPDGTHIAFKSLHSGSEGLWIANSDGTAQARLVDEPGGTPRWSPDSEKIVFDLRSEGSDFDIWTVAADGGPPSRFTEGDADDHSPSWSRDGDWIYFASDRGAGFQLWKKHVRSGEEIQVTRDGGFYSEESVDGRFVYYTKGRQDWTVWRAPAGGGEEVPVLESVSTWNNFAVGEDGIYYTPRRGPDGMSPIRLYDFDDGSVTEVYAPDRPTSNGISVSSDGRRLLYAQIDYGGSDLMLVEDFR